ncbi:MAG: hypothetical protein ABI186_03300 [Candidatus Elarobacter sp.]
MMPESTPGGASTAAAADHLADLVRRLDADLDAVREHAARARETLALEARAAAAQLAPSVIDDAPLRPDP